jgi:hypothetical protein
MTDGAGTTRTAGDVGEGSAACAAALRRCTVGVEFTREGGVMGRERRMWPGMDGEPTTTT